MRLAATKGDRAETVAIRAKSACCSRWPGSP